MRPRVGTLVAGLALAVGIGPTAMGSARAAKPFPLIFESTRTNNGDLYVWNGRNLAPLAEANSPGHDCGPAFSPNGRYLAFESNRLIHPFAADATGYNPQAPFHLFKLDLLTHRLTRLTSASTSDAFPEWSPDGRKIAFTREQPAGRLSIWTINADGSHPRQLTYGDDRLAHLNPAWSPDGKEIVYTVADSQALKPSAIYVMNADGSNQRLLTDNGAFPGWSPNGSQIAFDSWRDQLHPLTPALYVMAADGTRARRVGLPDGANLMPRWSPDGHHIAYVHDPDGWAGAMTFVLPNGDGQDLYETGPQPAHVWVLDLSSGKSIEVSNGEADLFPHYSPVRDIG